MSRTRRAVLALAPAALVAGCATADAPVRAPVAFTPPLPARGTRLRLAPVHVAEDRVIRVVAGSRPYRRGGFVVRTEAFGDKRLVHDYGHGGGGVTLSWGTADLAVEQGWNPEAPDCAVIGCGAVGLATARLLQRRGARVTIYAERLPPDTTSNIAGAQWWPASVYDHDVASAAFIAQHAEAARRAYRHFQTLVGPTYGVDWRRNYFLGIRPGRGPAEGADDPLRAVAPERRELEPGEHPFGDVRALQIDTMHVEPAVYLQAMLEDVLTAGGKLEVRRFNAAAELQTLSERTIFNCTGLGSAALFGDAELTPVKGQLVVLLPQPEVTYNLLRDGLYMFPRSDGIVLGGSWGHGDPSVAPDDAVTRRILAGHRRLFAPIAADVARG